MGRNGWNGKAWNGMPKGMARRGMEWGGEGGGGGGGGGRGHACYTPGGGGGGGGAGVMPAILLMGHAYMYHHSCVDPQQL